MNAVAVRAEDQAYLDAIQWVLPVFEDPWLGQAARRYLQGVYSEMRACARQARRESEEPFVVRGSMTLEGIAAGLMGDLFAAGELLIQSANGWAVDPIVELNLGVLLVKAGHWERAQERFELSVQHEPNEPLAWAYLAIIRFVRQDWPGVRAAAAEALPRRPACADLVRLCLLNADAEEGLPVDPAILPAADGAGAQSSGGEALRDLELPPVPLIFLPIPAQDIAAAEPLIWSLRAVQPDWAVHLHVLGPLADVGGEIERLAAEAAPLRLGWSSERLVAPSPNNLRHRLQTDRFAQLRQVLRRARGPVILAEPGLLLRRPPAEWLLPSDDKPVVLAHQREGAIEARVHGQLAAFQPGVAADRFLAEVMAACGSELIRDGARDRLDQVALWAALQRCEASGTVRLLPADEVLDAACGETSVAWTGAGGAEPFAAYEAGLRAAHADYRTLQAPEPPTNQLVPSTYGRMLINRYDTHISPTMRARGGGEVVDEIELLRQFLRPGATVLDVGANIGTHTVPFCQLVGPRGKVIAFEPQRVIYQIMVANVALNSCLNAFCRQAAVGAKRGKLLVPSIEYNLPANFGMMSFRLNDWEPIASPDRPEGEEVEVVTLDSLRLDACDLLKIDVEGMESEVLIGAAKTIRTHRPVIYMECFDSAPGQAAMAELTAVGYRVLTHTTQGGHNVLCLPAERGYQVVGMTDRSPAAHITL